MNAMPTRSLLTHSQPLTQKICASLLLFPESFIMWKPIRTVAAERVPKMRLPMKRAFVCF